VREGVLCRLVDIHYWLHCKNSPPGRRVQTEMNFGRRVGDAIPGAFNLVHQVQPL